MADAHAPDKAILASNTSSISITRLAAVTSRPEQVIGMHFFNPVPVMKLVEVIRGVRTSTEVSDGITSLAEEIGEVPGIAEDSRGSVSKRTSMPSITEDSFVGGEGA